MSDTVIKSDEINFKLRHDIECNTNAIKSAIPDLITRMEYNKWSSDINNTLGYDDVKLAKINSDTISFLKHLEQYSAFHVNNL